MKRLLGSVLAFFTFAVAAVALSVAAPASADPSGTCPDGFLLTFAPGDRHDKNANGIVCRKIQDARRAGGPDDNIDDIIL